MARTPIRIDRIHIQNFRGIDDLVLEFPAIGAEDGGVAVLAGDNGCGKTAVLDAIVTGVLKDSVDDSDRRFGAEFTEVVVDISRGDNSTRGRFTRSPRTTTRPLETLPLPWHRSDGSVPGNASLLESYEKPGILYIPAGHRQEKRVIGALEQRLVNLYHRSRGAHPEHSPFLRLQRFLQRFFGSDFQFNVLPESEQADSEFAIFTSRADVPIDVTSFEMARRAAVDRKDIPVLVPMEKLSAGMVEVVVLAGQVLFSDAPPDVMLIDEPEQHFHVRWQRHILPALRDLSPTTQFIVATHSLDVLDSVLNAERFLLVANDDWRDRDAVPVSLSATGTGE